MRWQPHVTVAAIIERENQFLVVEEDIENQLLLNQPAGHWENGETLIEAVMRETLEETAWHFVPEYLVGIYQWQHPDKADTTYLRFAFSGSLTHFDENRQLDSPIVRTLWQNHEDLIKNRARHRSPQLLLCINDYLNGNRFPLNCLVNVKN
ncbi:MAG: NUDIX hydrolase [Gammaproteobacteria bacterium]|nr:NUDIX hydrolase [Gammaproteobacteria bacterium]